MSVRPCGSFELTERLDMSHLEGRIAYLTRTASHIAELGLPMDSGSRLVEYL